KPAPHSSATHYPRRNEGTLKPGKYIADRNDSGMTAGVGAGNFGGSLGIILWQEENGMAKPRIKHKTWVVVADGGRALIMRNDGDAVSPRLTVLRKYGDHVPPTREQGSDKPGRTNASVGVNRSAMEQTDWHRQAEDSLMREVADDLLADLRRQEFSS